MKTSSHELYFRLKIHRISKEDIEKVYKTKLIINFSVFI